ncbi:MAG: signal peptidase I [Gorillibacterium sp.]|nr:signal peptidase I [Gorillibacterium sp.]
MKQENDGLFVFIKQIIQKNGWIEISAHGSSMYPLIQEESICRFHPMQKENISRGDIILFHSTSGDLIAHRLYAVIHQHHECLYLCKGDTNLGADEPIQAKQILGVLYSIRKSKKDIFMTDLLVSLWTKAILSLPFISKAINRYVSRKKPIPAERPPYDWDT